MMAAPLPRPRRPRPVAPLVTSSLDFTRFAILTCIGFACGLVVPSLGPLREPILVIAFVALSVRLFNAIVRKQFTLAWALTAYLCALEPAFRAHAPVIPYLALDYVLLAFGVITYSLSRPRKAARALPAVAYAIYIILEITGSVRADGWSLARGIVLPSLVMLIFVMNSTRARLTPTGTTFILASYVAGAVTLTGFALRSYLSGHITWNTESNIEASGGMPPNHISVLMSVAVFACVVLSEQAKRLQRLALLGVSTVLGALMVLTFSRGGTAIVVGSLLLYYVVLRRTNRRTIFALIAIAIVGLLISYGTSEITGGKVADRYGRTDTSNRFTILVQGWGIYLDHPIMGVGTSNFREAITETKFGRVTGAHNELVRAAAEHGTPGLIAWLVFITGSFLVALRDGEALRARRGLRVVILVFATTSMFYNGLKLTIQPMLIMLAMSAFTAADPALKPGPVRKTPALT